MAGDWRSDSRPIRAVGVFADAAIDPRAWPASLPAVAEFLRVAAAGAPFGGWEFGTGVTFLVGENGSGKSTLLEGIAEAAGLPVEGGSQNGGVTTRRSESPLGSWLKIIKGNLSGRGGFFLRAETMHGYYTWLESLPGSPDRDLHGKSHGESFNALLERKLNNERYVTGLVLLDEPEAALSFDSTLRWIANLDAMRARGTQVICATHSPLLCSLPGATILELGEWGIRESEWEDLELVRHHRSYLASPQRYLRHLLADGD
ncbi:AAA family ATPase [Microbacterium sp.]|uniref:AAA family ATPase n=1 Tax=Microbacterium sp. TaxID=51671 RepID=UPI003C779854